MKRFIGIDFDFGALKTAGPTLLGVRRRCCSSFLALGVMAWGTALTNGGAVMAMRDNYPWGLWFTNYMYYVGLSAGGLVVYASVHLFGAEQFRPLSRLAVLQAGVLVDDGAARHRHRHGAPVARGLDAADAQPDLAVRLHR